MCFKRKTFFDFVLQLLNDRDFLLFLLAWSKTSNTLI